MTVAERMLREKLVAHAPPVPHWFEPTMGSPRPCLLPEDAALREEYLDRGISGERRYPTEALAAWMAEHAEDLEHEIFLAREWDEAQERQRLLQWPWAYADGVMAARDASARRICRAVDDAVTHSIYRNRTVPEGEPPEIAFGLEVCVAVSATDDEIAKAVDDMRRVVTSSVLRELVRLGILPDRDWKPKAKAVQPETTVAVEPIAPQIDPRQVAEFFEALR